MVDLHILNLNLSIEACNASFSSPTLVGFDPLGVITYNAMTPKGPERRRGALLQSMTSHGFYAVCGDRVEELNPRTVGRAINALPKIGCYYR
jgi:hypothetical protein